MSKITSVQNGDSGLAARNKINTAIETVEVDGNVLTGDGNVGTEITFNEANVTTNLLPFTSTTPNITATNVEDAINEVGEQVSTVDTIINSLSDLPAPVGNTITLEPFVNYKFGSFVDFGTNRLITPGGSTITGLGLFQESYNYDGTLPFITGPNIQLNDLRYTHTNGAELLDIDGVAFDFVFLVGVFPVHPNDGGYGVLTGISDLSIRFCGSVNVANGIKLEGVNWNTIDIDGWNLVSASPTFVGLDITGTTLNRTKIEKLVIQAPSGAIGFKGDAGSANVSAGRILTFNNGGFIGGMTPLDGIASDDFRYSFSGNDGLMDSTVDANPYLLSPVTVVVPTGGQGTFYKINQSNWSFTAASRLSVSSDGDITNLLEIPVKIDVNGFVTAQKQGGGNDFLAARLVYNDLTGDPSSVVTENGTQNSQPTSIPLTGIFTLNPGDSVSIYVANLDSTDDIIIENAKFTALRVL